MTTYDGAAPQEGGTGTDASSPDADDQGDAAMGLGTGESGDPCPMQYMACGALCVDPQSDNINCGGCGSKCPLGMMCQQGACTPVNTHPPDASCRFSLACASSDASTDASADVAADAMPDAARPD
jgi:hypothetical protein